jgi:hypothetical protein
MSFVNPTRAQIQELLRSARIIAVCGLSTNPARPSCRVSASMQKLGYQIIPVNPRIAIWRGLPAVATLNDAVTAVGSGRSIDIVNVFRRPSTVDEVVDDCMRLGVPALWLQVGVINEAAARRALSAGMTVVMDRCIIVERSRMEA